MSEPLKELTAPEWLVKQAAAAMARPDDYGAVMVISVGRFVPGGASPRVQVHGWGQAHMAPVDLLRDLAEQLTEQAAAPPSTLQ